MVNVNFNATAWAEENRRKKLEINMENSIDRLSTGQRTVDNQLQASLNKFGKFSSNPTITGTLTVQEERNKGYLRDIQLVGNWGFTDEYVEKFNKQEQLSIIPSLAATAMVAQANQQSAGVLKLLE